MELKKAAGFPAAFRFGQYPENLVNKPFPFIP